MPLAIPADNLVADAGSVVATAGNLVAAAGSTTDTSTLAIGVTVVATVVIIVLLAAVASMIRAAVALRRAAEDLRRDSHALLAELHGTLDVAGAELDRVDGLIGSAESITDTVGSASRLAYLALANPVVKVMAFGAGTANASRHWRQRRGTGSAGATVSLSGRRTSGPRDRQPRTAGRR